MCSEYIATFGSKHKWFGYYLKIHASNKSDVYNMMFEKYNDEWSEVYDKCDIDVNKHHLILLDEIILI